MKQLLQNLKSGAIEIIDVPSPACSPGHCLIRTRASLISTGTERSLVTFGQSNLLAKAQAQPDKVKQVLDKIKTDGLLPTLETVFNRLDEPMPLGYCNAGEILETCDTFATLRSSWNRGDRVVSNGSHSEIVCIPYNLCAKIPEGVTDQQAAFTVLASIGLQAQRLAQPTLGEKFVVYGLGLIGLLTVQLLQANGCQVLCIDINSTRLALAEKYGAVPVDATRTDPVDAAMAWTGGRGVDGVIIAASAQSDDIVHHSAQMCRKRGRIVLVGVVGLGLRRSDFYEKELTFQVSCSYGPGRYDENYERAGRDYPYGFVRWTEQRNFEAVLEMLHSGRLRVDELITHRFAIEQASQAYDTIAQDAEALGVLFSYPAEADRSPIKAITSLRTAIAPGKPALGIIGAGNFTKMTLMPALKQNRANLAYVADLKADAAAHLAKKYGAATATTDYKIMLQDPAVHAVIIAVGHEAHARLVCEALQAGKHVFVEKPLALNTTELQTIIDTCRAHPSSLTVGFNRRFSPHTKKIKSLLQGRREPLAMNITVNAGSIPAHHWTQDPDRGGGRIIGEACHFLDLCVYLAGAPVRTVAAQMMRKGTAVKEDKMSISLGFADGSVGTVNYYANGTRSYPKEVMEVFSEGRVVRLENFRMSRCYGFKGCRAFKTWRQDKGHVEEFRAFLSMLEAGGEPLIPFADMVNVTLASFAAMTSAIEERTIIIDKEYQGWIYPQP